MATATVRLAAPGTPWLTVTDPVTGDPVPALADGVRRHPDGSLAEVTLTFRARGVPPLGFLRYPLAAAPGRVRPGSRRRLGGRRRARDRERRVRGDRRGGARRARLGRRQGRRARAADQAGQRPGRCRRSTSSIPGGTRGRGTCRPRGRGSRRPPSAATVRAQRSPVGSRLVATYSLGDLSVTAETLLWDGADRVEFRTPRVRVDREGAPAAGAVPRRPARRAAGVPDGDGGHRAAVRRAGSGRGRALVDPGQPGEPLVRHRVGGAACRSPPAAATFPWRSGWPRSSPLTSRRPESRPAVKDLLTWLARAGVTATSLALVRDPLRVGRPGLQPARLPHRARRAVVERVHRRGPRGVRPVRRQAARPAGRRGRRGAAVGARGQVARGGVRAGRGPARAA